jgi:hypothetical protein
MESRTTMDKLELNIRVARLERRFSLLTALLATVVLVALGAALLMTTPHLEVSKGLERTKLFRILCPAHQEAQEIRI